MGHSGNRQRALAGGVRDWVPEMLRKTKWDLVDSVLGVPVSAGPVASGPR